jgi:hypothetical protein
VGLCGFDDAASYIIIARQSMFFPKTPDFTALGNENILTDGSALAISLFWNKFINVA